MAADAVDRDADGDLGARRLAIVQYAGDYREAFERLAGDGPETYQAQRASVDFVASLARRGVAVTVIVLMTDEPHDVVLAEGLRAIGLGWRAAGDLAEVTRLLDAIVPDRLLLRTPLLPLFDWARRRGVRVLATLADSFGGTGPRAWLRRWRFRRAFTARGVDWVGNHGRNAAFELRTLGVPADRIVPWDWPPAFRPDAAAKRRAPDDARFDLFFAGLLTHEKGLFDLVEAVGALQRAGRDVGLRIAGKGDTVALAAAIEAAGAPARIELLGLIPNVQVGAEMRAADAVVVPSRHEYPEGLPLTIYEALAARTPLIVSDHPMFAGNVVDGESALVFPAGDVGAIAACVARLIDEPSLYAAVSTNTAAAWEALQLPVTWMALVERWLNDRPEDREWLRAHSLASGMYERR